VLSEKIYSRGKAKGDENGGGMLWYIAYGQEGLAQIALARCEMEKALDFAKMGVATADKSGYLAVEAKCMATLADVFLHKKEYRNVLKTAHEALAVSPEAIQLEPALAYNIAIASMFLGEKESSARYFDIYSAQMKKNAAKSFRETMTGMEIQYETEKKELQIAALEKGRKLYVGIGVSCAALLVALLLLYAYHRQINKQKIEQLEQEKQIVASQAVIDGETEERRRIAHELHDGLGGMLSSVRLNLDNVEYLENARELLTKSIEELRRISHNLMPASLQYGIKPAMEEFCRSLPNVHFHYYGSGEPLGEKTNLTLYRYAHELINNSLKHSGATDINVQLAQAEDAVTLTISDNGCGFDVNAVSAGMGLDNIRSRVAIVGGKIEIISSKENGTETTIELRVKNEKI
jgi:signal transduction histidine kinase